ncbi:hypothetical protein T4A_7319 [Trichinella pseudospiralis]|uniref:Uncharacterized protein n=1 Tax=Trichinella pseudospiralis TaxID=6337 RepID=A0A0V1DSD5_TRIPS|nr:hypothetical protein T4A_7319 [Trichinella pseudospiralis]
MSTVQKNLKFQYALIPWLHIFGDIYNELVSFLCINAVNAKFGDHLLH